MKVAQTAQTSVHLASSTNVVALVAELAISNTDVKFWKPTQWNNVPGGIC